MKQGRKLEDLLAELNRQANAKHDYIVDTREIRISADASRLLLPVTAEMNIPPDQGNLLIQNTAYNQIAEFCKIPKVYLDRMREKAPELVATNIEAWFNKYPAPRMIRTLDTGARAFLSDKYRQLDNFDLASAVVPVLFDLGVVVMSCEVTEDSFYLKVVDERIKNDVPAGHRIGDGSHVFFDTVSPACVLRNSETGLGSLSVDYGIFTKVCTNLATLSKEGMRRAHLGARHAIASDENIVKLLSDETRAATDKATFMQVVDVIKGIFDPDRFKAVTNRVAGMHEEKIAPAAVQKCVEVTQKKFGLTETDGAAILAKLIEGGNLTRYGLMSAVTRAAQDADDYEKASAMEKIGGQIIDLTPQDWKVMAEAA
jgi:hypothetical protein